MVTGVRALITAMLLVAAAGPALIGDARAQENRGVQRLPAVGDAAPVSAVQPAERRVALVIGNGAYRNATPLPNPPNDAKTIAEIVQDAGFELVGGKAQLDLDRAATEKVIRTFGQMLRGGAIGLFYYAGHGLQISGVNYLVPISAELGSEADVKYELVDVNFILDEMLHAGNRLNMVLLDACRNNPFGGRGMRSVSSGLAQMQAPSGTVISYATQPGNVAADGTGGGNSPYTTALAESIRTPGRSVFEVFNDVGIAVKKKTGGTQQPWLATSPIEGQFYFKPAATPVAVASVAPPSPAAAPVQAMMSADKEALYWETIKDSRNPAYYRAYLEQFPTGVFAGLARAKLAAIPASAPPPAPASTSTPVPARVATTPPPAPPQPASVASSPWGKVAAAVAPQAPPRSARTVAFNADKVPYLSEQQRTKLDGYQNGASPKALAIGDRGAFAFLNNSNGEMTEDDARRRVLERCEYYNKSACVLYSVNGIVLQPETSTPNPTPAPIQKNGHFDPATVPFITQSSRDTKMPAFASGREHKALAIHPSGAWASVTARPSVEAAREAALQNCTKHREDGCIIYAVDDEVVFDRDTPPPEPAERGIWGRRSPLTK
ncbi:MAG: caspase family protein [Rhodospirillaceae bacterium]